MRVYGNSLAPTTQMVLHCLAEKGESAELSLIDFSKGEQRAPAHLARHPFGLTPVFEDAHGMLCEARAIIRYLDRTLAGPALTPTQSRAFGLMEQFMGVEQSYFSPHIMLFYYRKFLGRPADAAAVATARASAAKALDMAEAALAAGPYLAGETFSLADIAWQPYLAIAHATEQGDLITTRPHVDAWWQRISARPAWQHASTPSRNIGEASAAELHHDHH